MKKNMLFILMLVFAFSVKSQTAVFINNGGNAINSVAIGNLFAIDYSKINTTTIVEDLINNNIKVYPTVADDFINITSDKNITYKMYDVNGKIVLTGNKKQVNVSFLPKGIYILNIEANNFKIIKQ